MIPRAFAATAMGVNVRNHRHASRDHCLNPSPHDEFGVQGTGGLDAFQDVDHVPR